MANLPAVYAGIPTMYAGVRFRSRLEARWAAFFDMVEWKWLYEPFDLPGWIPDFQLIGAKEILVEVKPIIEFDDDIAQEIFLASASRPKAELLLLGTNPENDTFGWLCEIHNRDDTGERVDYWAPAKFGRYEGAETPGFCHSESSFYDRISGRYDGGVCGGIVRASNVQMLWREAGNIVQWKAP